MGSALDDLNARCSLRLGAAKAACERYIGCEQRARYERFGMPAVGRMVRIQGPEYHHFHST
jgi:hypothetical protein